MDALARRTLAARLRELLEPTLSGLGFDVVAIDITGDQAGRILRVSIDRPGGVQVSDCTRASHAISPELDATDPIPGAYRLEVSSPGIERPLQRLVDFQRFRGFKARLRLLPGPGRRNWTGTLLGVEDEHVLLNAEGEQARLPFSEIDRARLELTDEEFLALGQNGLPSLDGDPA